MPILETNVLLVHVEHVAPRGRGAPPSLGRRHKRPVDQLMTVATVPPEGFKWIVPAGQPDRLGLVDWLFQAAHLVPGSLQWGGATDRRVRLKTARQLWSDQNV